MAKRVLGGIDVSSTVANAFDGVLEPLVLVHGGADLDCRGVWSRTDDGSMVTLIAELGELKDVRPQANDVVKVGTDVAMRVLNVGGFDGVAWRLQCSAPLEQVERAAAPTITAQRYTGGTSLRVVASGIASGVLWRSRWRYAAARGWSGILTTEARTRILRSLESTSVVEIESVTLDSSGKASAASIVVVPVLP